MDVFKKIRNFPLVIYSFMAKRSLLRRSFNFIVYTTLLWILVATIWLVLPSREPDDNAVTSALQNGEMVTRVYPMSNVANTHFVVRFQIIKDTKNGSHTLVMGAGKDELNRLLFRAPSPAQPYSHLPLEVPKEPKAEDSSVHQTELWLHKATDAMPLDWSILSTADRVILNHYVGAHEAGYYPYYTYTDPVKQVIEIHGPSVSYVRPTPGVFTPMPLISFHLSSNNTAPVVTFHPSSSSPTGTLDLRIIFLFFLLPVGAVLGTVLYSIFGLAAFALFASYAVLKGSLLIFIVAGFVWWIRNGRPAIPWSEFRDSLRGAVEVRRREIQTAASVRVSESSTSKPMKESLEAAEQG